MRKIRKNSIIDTLNSHAELARKWECNDQIFCHPELDSGSINSIKPLTGRTNIDRFRVKHGMTSRTTAKVLSAAALVGVTFGAPAYADVINTPQIIQEGETTSIIGKEISNVITEWNNDTAPNPVKNAEYIYLHGGAIENYGTITEITNSTFSNNKNILNVDRTEKYTGYYYTEGGIIYNEGNIKSISNSVFKNNIISSSKDDISKGDYTLVVGGILENKGTISEINNVEFANNDIYVHTEGSRPGEAHIRGGLIHNTGTIGGISGSFHDNTVKRESHGGFPWMRGGLLYNNDGGYIKEINATFENNKIEGKTNFGSWSYIPGGLILNDKNSTIEKITGTFKDNDVTLISDLGAQINGLIDNKNEGTIKDIVTTRFENNKIHASSGPGNYAQARGIAIVNEGQMDKLSGIFIKNSALAEDTQDGACSSLSSSGAILNSNTLLSLSGTFIENSAKTKSYSTENGVRAVGGAIENTGTIKEIKNSKFVDNFVEADSISDTPFVKGGAIYSSTDLNIVSDNGVTEFRGNKTILNGEEDDNAIYLDKADGNINFELKNGGSVILKDNIRGAVVAEKDEDGNETGVVNRYNVNISGDDVNKTTFYLHNDIYEANVSIGNTTLNTVNDTVHSYNFNSLTITGDTNMVADVDLANSQMDRFTANSYGEHQGNLNVVGMNLLSDAKGDTTEILFAEQGLKDNVTNGTGELPDKYQTAYTPIYKYNVNYDNREDGGYFVFSRGGRNGGSEAFNPSVLSAPVSSVAASQATVNETFKYVFEHADAFTQMPSLDRQAKINANKYALSTDYNENREALNYDLNNKAGWFRPYVTFETMNLKHGPKVDAITYGSIVGFDTDFFEHKNGWYSVGTGYIGYNGNQLKYQGVDTTMNGGLLGYTHTMYKGNFWSALTLSAGASVGETKTMYGKEDFTSLMAGLGSKTGYNFEFKQGKYILQPIMFMSYSFVNTFDYTNAAGVKVKPSPAHSIQLNPSVKFIANTKNGWQPYAQVGMVWNVMNENKVTANSVRLPEMGMKPYVEYGVGLQRSWKDKFTAFGQAMIRNGGRNGIALTGGLRWSLGKEGKPIEKVNEKVNVVGLKTQPTYRTSLPVNGEDNKMSLRGEAVAISPSTNGKTVLKQLTPAQKTALGRGQNTTRTTSAGVLKQL